MRMDVTVAVDCMGGDHGAHVTVPAAVACLRADAAASCILVGRREAIERELSALHEAPGPRLSVRHAAEVVEMDEAPASALRGKKDSSMRVAIDLVKEGTARACVSAGNTGALMATSRFVLKTLPGIERPAIATTLPSLTGRTYMLDLGANTKATPEQLRQFAFMGSIVARDIHRIERPRVGLLNIGDEEMKGHEVVQGAHALLEASGLNYVGFVEGNDIFSGEVDVVVTDGFTGNVALKTMEGVAGLIARRMKREFTASALDKLAGLVAQPVLRRVAAGLDPRRYNGACMVGLNGIVVKSHGGADEVAFARAIALSAIAVRQQLTLHVSQALNVQGA